MPLSERKSSESSARSRVSCAMTPDLARQVGSTTIYSHALRQLRWGIVGFIAAFALTIFLLTVSVILAFTGFLAMVACAIVVERAARRMGRAGIGEASTPRRGPAGIRERCGSPDLDRFTSRTTTPDPTERCDGRAVSGPTGRSDQLTHPVPSAEHRPHRPVQDRCGLLGGQRIVVVGWVRSVATSGLDAPACPPRAIGPVRTVRTVTVRRVVARSAGRAVELVERAEHVRVPKRGGPAPSGSRRAGCDTRSREVLDGRAPRHGHPTTLGSGAGAPRGALGGGRRGRRAPPLPAPARCQHPERPRRSTGSDPARAHQGRRCRLVAGHPRCCRGSREVVVVAGAVVAACVGGASACCGSMPV